MDVHPRISSDDPLSPESDQKLSTPTSSRKVSLLSDGVHERRPSQVVDRRPSARRKSNDRTIPKQSSGRLELTSDEQRPSDLVERRSNLSTSLSRVPSSKFDVLSQTSSKLDIVSQNSNTSQITSFAESDGATIQHEATSSTSIPEELPIPEDIPEEPTELPEFPKRESPIPPASVRSQISRASRDDPSKMTSKLREGLLASIRGFRKAIKGVFASGDEGEERPSTPTSSTAPTPKHNSAALVSFVGVDAVARPNKPDAEPDLVQTVGSSEAYGSYFRMLRMGVPVGAVKNKMAGKGLNGAVLDLGEDGLLSRALLLEQAYQHELERKLASPALGEKLHWEVVNPAELAPGRETIWTAQTEPLLPPGVLDEAKIVFVLGKNKTEDNGPAKALEAISEDSPHTTAKKKVVVKAGPVAKTALDPRRAQGLNIMVKKLKVTPASLCEALKKMDERVLTPNAIEVLLATVVWPASEEERTALSRLVDSGVELQGADALVWQVHTQVPDAESRIRAMTFRYEFDNSLSEINKHIVVVKLASMEVVASERLKKIMLAVLALGNKVNEGSGAPAQGFALSSLAKLGFARSIDDKNLSMLDFLAKALLQQMPDTLRVMEDLPSLPFARRVTLIDQMRFMRESRRAVEGLRKVQELEVFAFTAMNSLDTVESQLGVARDFFDRACGYFAIERGAMDSHEFFDALFVFLDGLRVIVDKARTEAEKAAKALKKQQEQAELDAQIAAGGGKKQRKSILQRVSGVLSGPPRPPVPVFKKPPKD